MIGGALAGLTTADIVVSHADAGITCGTTTTPTCPVNDFMTGGGYILLPDSSKGTFGLVGGVKASGYQGHPQYVDHSASGPDISGSAVTGYSGSGTARTISYTCAVNGVAGTCSLNVSDNGEPGGGVDSFSLSTAGYSASGHYITQGNIQLHNPSCPSGSGSTGGKKH